MSSHAAAASIIEKNASDIARNACGHLLSNHAEIGKRFGDRRIVLFGLAVMLIGVQKSEGGILPGRSPSAQAAQVLQASIVSGRPTF